MNRRPITQEAAAILFDIDGTLVDSTPAVERTWRTWASGRGLDAEEIIRRAHGRRSEDTIADLLPPPERDEAVAELLDLELNDLDGVIALPNAASVLGSLPDHLWAAVTSGSRDLMTRRLEAAGLPLPRVLIAAEDVTQGKPDPQGYLAAAARLGVDPTGCVVVEDAPAGIHAGRNAGAWVLGVATSHQRDDLEAADLVITDLTECLVETTTDRLRLTLGGSRPR